MLIAVQLFRRRKELRSLSAPSLLTMMPVEGCAICSPAKPSRLYEGSQPHSVVGLQLPASVL